MSKSKKNAGKGIFRDRVKELRWVKASELKPNPKNWRIHPKEQKSALEGILKEVGCADVIIARELSDGTLEIIDGHLRAETMGEMIVPVLILDCSQEEADKLMFAFDPLSTMAEVNREKFDELISIVDIKNDTWQEMLDDIAEKNSSLQHDIDAREGGFIPNELTIEFPKETKLDIKEVQLQKVKCPKCDAEFYI